MVWLCSSGLKGEMESSIIAAQYRALDTHYHQRNMMRQPVAGCTTLAPPEYANRHRKVAGYIH
jgi:hypothetical protein